MLENMGLNVKTCTLCKEEKTLDQMAKSRNCTDGIYSWCKKCSAAKRKEWRSDNIEKEAEARKKLYWKDIEGAATSYKRWRIANPDKCRRINKNSKLKKEFGISIEIYDNMRASQNYKCAICGRHESEDSRALSMDHDHATSKLRDLLCNRCNLGLGQFMDSPEILEVAKTYILRHRGV